MNNPVKDLMSGPKVPTTHSVPPEKKRPQIQVRYGTRSGRSVGQKVAAWLQVLIPTRKKGPVDIAYLEAAEAKRERRRIRNLRWWSHDSNWHREILASKAR